MELNGDGRIDILSGSYSRQDENMAGLFQVLWGKPDGTFAAPEGLKGSDGELLLITPITAGDAEADGDTMIQKICTRPYAADLDGDGHLDLVAGNFGGTFAFFRGEGKGKFAAKNSWLEAAGKPMTVPHHSDPFLVDWDHDGDLDLLSGSSSGGAFLFLNEGSKTAPKFAAAITLLPEHQHAETMPIGDAHLQGPQGSTRVWAADVDGDGKLDLLVGDQVRLAFAVDGVEAATAQKQLLEHGAKVAKLYEQMSKANEAEQEALQKQVDELDAEKAKFVREEATGFVWLLRQK